MDGDTVLKNAVEKLKIDLAQLVAETSVWVNPHVFHTLRAENGHGVWYENIRRYKKGKGEKPNDIVDGIRLDHNSYANDALKYALGLGTEIPINFTVCHIWENSCYDPRYHTCVANLVLVPRAIFCLTDYDEITQKSLQYRAYELYTWYPHNRTQPQRPQGYPMNWNDPIAFNSSAASNLRRRKPAYR